MRPSWIITAEKVTNITKRTISTGEMYVTICVEWTGIITVLV